MDDSGKPKSKTEALSRTLWERYFAPPQRGLTNWRGRAAVASNANIEMVGPNDGTVDRVAGLLGRYLGKFRGWPVPPRRPRVQAIEIRHDGPDPMAGRVPDERFTLRVQDGRARLTAHTVRGAVAGILYLMQRMELERGPALPLGTQRVKPRFARRTCRGALGLQMDPGFDGFQEPEDWQLELTLLTGANGVQTALDLALVDDGRCLPELGSPENLQRRERLIGFGAKLASYGLDLACCGYNPRLAADHPLWQSHPEMRGAQHCSDAPFHSICSGHRGAVAALGKCWANLAEDVPSLGALIWIIGGEGFYHCYMRADPRPGGKTNCPRCRRKPPQKTVAQFTNQLAQSVHAARDDVEIIAWPYSGYYFWTGDTVHADLIANLAPAHVSFITCPGKDSTFDRGEHDIMAWDYSITCVGPGPRFRAQRKLCRERGIPFHVKTETSFAFEFTGVRFVPALDRWHERWQVVRRARPQGAMLSLGDGALDTTTDLGYWAAWATDQEFQNVLPGLASARFGKAAGDVRGAWRHFSEAMGVYPLVAPGYQKGPSYIGPAQPVSAKASVLEDPFYRAIFIWMLEDHPAGTPEEELPWQPCAVTKLEQLMPYILPHDLDRPREAILEDAMEKAQRRWGKGMQLMSRARRNASGRRERATLAREEAIAKWIGMSITTFLHFIRVLRLQSRLPLELPSKVERPQVWARVSRAITSALEAERKNVLKAQSLVGKHPELDFVQAAWSKMPSPEEMLAHKLSRLDQELEERRADEKAGFRNISPTGWKGYPAMPQSGSETRGPDDWSAIP